MKTLLSLVIPAWFGAIIGAAIDDYTPNFWKAMVFLGIGIVIVTVVYVNTRRTHLDQR